jgi:hypothetical protein
MSSPVVAATAKKPSLTQRKAIFQEEWQSALGAILSSLVGFLRVDLPFIWVRTSALFDESTLPPGLTMASFLGLSFIFRI